MLGLAQASAVGAGTCSRSCAGCFAGAEWLRDVRTTQGQLNGCCALPLQHLQEGTCTTATVASLKLE
jgi:hypothetical protein